MKILLVDDSSTMRRIQKNTLEKLGYTDITEAGDGAEAVAKVAAGTYDLVLMDWNMPNMTGIEALKKIKEALRLYPDYPEALCLGGFILGEAGQTDAALRFYDQALGFKPDFLVALSNSGKLPMQSSYAL